MMADLKCANCGTASGSLAGQSDAMLCDQCAPELHGLAAEKRDEMHAEIEGELVFWDTEGGLLPSAIEIGGKDLSLWLAEQLNIPVIARGVPAEGKYGRIILTLKRARSS